MKLKQWFEKTLLTILTFIFMFIVITIESIGNHTYMIIVLILSVIALPMIWLLFKYGQCTK